jgi:hypothetical protein
MRAHHKESPTLIWYVLIFFTVLAISAFSLLVQYQASSQSASEFFEPIRLPIEQGLF